MFVVYLQVQGGPKLSSVPNTGNDGFVLSQTEDLLLEQRSEVKADRLLSCVWCAVPPVWTIVVGWEEAYWYRAI